MDRQELLATVEETWRQLDEAIAGLDETALVEPGIVGEWSIKDLLGHVAAWEQVAIGHVERWRRGETVGGDGPIDVDDFNTREAARRHIWPLAHVQEEAADTRRRLRETLLSLSDDDWNTVAGAGERSGPLGEWVGGALGGAAGPGTHAADHAAHIRSWRQERDRRPTPDETPAGSG